MNTKLLRQKILDLAIRGKLTDQRKSDGTVRELLEQISASCHPEQSSKNAKSKNLTPITPLDKSEAPFEIPDNWEWVHLQDVGELSRGKSKHRPRNDPALYVDGFMPFVQTGDVAGAEKGLICKWHSLYNELGVAQSRIWPRGTICITIAANIGDVALLNFDACFPDSVVGFNAYKPIYSNKFFLFYLMLCKEKLDEKSRSTAQKNINIDILSQIYVPLPPIAEQQRIIEKIEEAFAEIDAVEKNKELLKTHIKQTRQKILDLAIHGKLVPQDENDEPASVLLEKILQEKAQSDNKKSPKKKKTADIVTSDNRPYEKVENIPFEIPAQWCWVNLKSISNILYGYPLNSALFNTEKGKMVVRIRDVQPAYSSTYTTENVPKEYILEKGDMLIGMDGNFNVNFWNTDGAILNQRVCKIKTKQCFYSQKFLFYTIPFFLNKIEKDVSFSTVKHLSDKHLTEMQVPLPSLKEQSRIVSKIEELFSALDQMEIIL